MEQHSRGMDWGWNVFAKTRGGGNVHRPAVRLDLAAGTFLHVGTARATGAAQAGIGHCCEAVESWDLGKAFSL